MIDGHPGPPILRPKPVGDVESRNDLHSGDERQSRRARDLHHLTQDAVDAITDDDGAFGRFDVDVARPAGDAIRQHHVYQPDDGALARLVEGDAQFFLVVVDLLDGTGVDVAQQF